MPVADDVRLDDLVARTAGYTGAEVITACENKGNEVGAVREFRGFMVVTLSVEPSRR